MMSALKRLWNEINAALESSTPEAIIDVFSQAMSHGNKETLDQHEFYYAAGYVAYMHPEGKRNAAIRKKAVSAFLLSLFHHPGFFPSVLYLAFIKMDEMKYLSALGLLYSHDRKFDAFEKQLVDRYYEATICCLIECGYWPDALRELEWFDQRKKEDSHVGINLINFMKVLEKANPATEMERKVVKSIEAVLE